MNCRDDSIALDFSHIVNAKAGEVLGSEFQPAGEGVAADDGVAKWVGVYVRVY